MKAKQFDEAFDKGEDITLHLDLDGARRSSRKQKRINVSFPEWMLESLDLEASRLGIPRQAIIKLWLSERLKSASDENETDQHPVA